MRWRPTIDKEQLFLGSFNARGVCDGCECGEGVVERREGISGQFFE